MRSCADIVEPHGILQSRGRRWSQERDMKGWQQQWDSRVVPHLSSCTVRLEENSLLVPAPGGEKGKQ